MSSPTMQPAKSDPPEESARQKATLGQFIDENSKLVTSIAVFVALTAFSSQLDNSDIKVYFAGLSFLAAALLSLELLMKEPARPHHWRLAAFSLVLTLLVGNMGWYWFSKFPQLWVPLLVLFVEMVVLMGLAGLLAHLLTKAIKALAARLFNGEIQADVMLRVSRFIFLVCIALVFAGLLWTSRRLAAHPIRVHIPLH